MKKIETKKLGIKIISSIITLIIVFCNFSYIAFAGDPATTHEQGQAAGMSEYPQAPSMESFDVSQYLKINEGQTYLDDSTKEDSQQQVALGKFIVDIISLITKIVGSLALLVIITGGITLMISTGNQNLQTKGKEMIKFAIMGLIFTFMSLIIVTFVQSLFYTQ